MIDQYRQYWGAYDFPTDFPSGVNYTIGNSDPAKDWVCRQQFTLVVKG